MCVVVQKRDKECTWNAFIKICRSLIDVLHFFLRPNNYLVFELIIPQAQWSVKGITRSSSANSPAFLLITAKKDDLKLKLLKCKYFCSIKKDHNNSVLVCIKTRSLSSTKQFSAHGWSHKTAEAVEIEIAVFPRLRKKGRQSLTFSK